MIQRTLTTITTAGFVLLTLTSTAWACMEHDDDFAWIEMSEEVEEEEASEEDESDAALNLPVLALEGDVLTRIECESDLACPAGLLCEPVACCTAEGCECPVGLCEAPSSGAQGRDCLADSDCGAGFECIAERAEGCEDASGQQGACATDLPGWCEALDAVDTSDEGLEGLIQVHAPLEAADELAGCQGGTDHSLPLSLALFFIISALVRARQHQTAQG